MKLNYRLNRTIHFYQITLISVKLVRKENFLNLKNTLKFLKQYDDVIRDKKRYIYNKRCLHGGKNHHALSKPVRSLNVF